MYCHKNGHEEKYVWKKWKDDEEKEKEKADVVQGIVHEDIFS